MRNVAFLGVGLALLLLQGNLFRLLDGIHVSTALVVLALAVAIDVTNTVRTMQTAPGHPRAIATLRVDFTLPALVLAGFALLASAHAHLGRPVPTLVFPLILFMGVHEFSLARGAGVVFVLGYATDVLGMAPVGLYTFTFVASFVLARAAGVRLAAQTGWMQVLLVGAFSVLQSTMVLVLLAIFGREPWVPRSLYPIILPHAAATAALAPLLFRVAAALQAATLGSQRPEPAASGAP